MSIRMASVSEAYLNCIWKRLWMSIRMASVSGAYLNCILRISYEWLSEWHPCLERIWTVSDLEIWMSIRMASVSGAYPYYLKDEFKWVSEWHPCLERICTVSEFEIWMSIRMASMSRAYLNYICKLYMNEHQNDICVWSVSKLYLKVGSKWVSEWHPFLERIWTVSEDRLWMSIRIASVSGAYLNCIESCL